MRPELEAKYLEQKKKAELFYKKAEKGKLKNAVIFDLVKSTMKRKRIDKYEDKYEKQLF